MKKAINLSWSQASIKKGKALAKKRSTSLSVVSENALCREIEQDEKEGK